MAKVQLSWIFCCFILLFITGAIQTHDIDNDHQAADSEAFTTESEVVAFTREIWSNVRLNFEKGFLYVEAHLPTYTSIVDFFNPYIKLTNDVYLVTKNVTSRQLDNIMNYLFNRPVVIETIDQYIPGVLESIAQIAQKCSSALRQYSAYIVEQAIEISVKATRWLKTNVFVGSFSPESIQNYASLAMKRIPIFANQTYDWVYEKYECYIKSRK